MNYPYNLNRFKNGHPTLSRKNANFIEAIIELDSDYGWISKAESVPNSNFIDVANPLARQDNPKRHYYGSIAYWANQLKNPNNNLSFDDNLLGFI